MSLRSRVAIAVCCLLAVIILWPKKNPTDRKVAGLIAQLQGGACRWDGLGNKTWAPFPKLTIRNPKQNCVVWAAEALGSMGEQARPAVPALCGELLNGEESFDTGDGVILVRPAIAKALGEIKDRQAVPALLQALRRSATPAQTSVLEALGNIGDRSQTTVDVLTGFLKDPSYEIRMGAARALCQIGSPAAMEFLIKTLRNAETAPAAADVLALLGPAAKEAAIPIAQAMVYDRTGNKWNGVLFLGALQAIGPAGSAAAPPIISLLQREEPETQFRAIKVLGAMKNPAALPALRKMLRSSVPEVRQAAVSALAQLDPTFVDAHLPKNADVQAVLADLRPKTAHYQSAHAILEVTEFVMEDKTHIKRRGEVFVQLPGSRKELLAGQGTLPQMAVTQGRTSWEVSDEEIVKSLSKEDPWVDSSPLLVLNARYLRPFGGQLKGDNFLTSLTLGKETTLNGVACYVLQKRDLGATTTYYIGKADGLIRRITRQDAPGALGHVVRIEEVYSEIKTNMTFPEGTFAYKPARSAKVTVLE